MQDRGMAIKREPLAWTVVALTLAGADIAHAAATHPEAAVASADTAAETLAKSLRRAAKHPNNFQALFIAGRAALRVGDAKAAAGFLGRAERIRPRSAVVQAAIGSTLISAGDPRSALHYFARAGQLGLAIEQIACDRGLAYDLLGLQAEAQRDYQRVLKGPQADEARRRLAVSLAVSGDKDTALRALQPLLARSDLAAHWTQVMILALSGDVEAAEAHLVSVNRDVRYELSHYLKRLPSLSAGQKVAAASLGLFPDTGSRVKSRQSGQIFNWMPDDNAIDGQADGDLPLLVPMEYGAPRSNLVKSLPYRRNKLAPMEYGSTSEPGATPDEEEGGRTGFITIDSRPAVEPKGRAGKTKNVLTVGSHSHGRVPASSINGATNAEPYGNLVRNSDSRPRGRPTNRGFSYCRLLHVIGEQV